MWGYGPYGMMGGWGGEWIFAIAMVVLVVALVLLFVRHAPHLPDRQHGAAALEGLKGRYARGEIERDEFLQKKKDLTD